MPLMLCEVEAEINFVFQWIFIGPAPFFKKFILSPTDVTSIVNQVTIYVGLFLLADLSLLVPKLYFLNYCSFVVKTMFYRS